MSVSFFLNTFGAVYMYVQYIYYWLVCCLDAVVLDVMIVWRIECTVGMECNIIHTMDMVINSSFIHYYTCIHACMHTYIYPYIHERGLTIGEL